MKVTETPDVLDGAREARALRWWREVELQALAALFDVVVEAWSRDWLIAEPSASELTDTVAQDGRFGDATRSPPSALWRDARGPLGALHETMFNEVRGNLGGAGDHPVVAEEALQAAWQDWCSRLSSLCPGLELDSGDAAPAIVQPATPWSGDVIVRVPWCNGKWEIALDGDRVAALLAAPDAALKNAPKPSHPSGTALASLQAALGGEKVHLRAELHGVTLTLGQLHELGVSDVIVLAHLLDQPLRLLCNDETLVCHGWLGQQRGRLALELAA